MSTAILVDGGFYRRRAYKAIGDISPKDRADELIKYCWKHLDWKEEGKRELYRIFYYDCPPLQGAIYHPYYKKNVKLEESELYDWSLTFFDELKKRRKVALRLGELSKSNNGYQLKQTIVNKLFRGEITLDDICKEDFYFTATQKGVDMRIGLDIASLAFKKQVDQIVLISGDSDFVPAAKLARREGVDFVLDPLFANINPSLNEHVDALRSCDKAFRTR